MNNGAEDLSLQDEIAAAIREASGKEDTTASDAVDALDQERDEQGRFVAKEDEQESESVEGGEQKPAQDLEKVEGGEQEPAKQEQGTWTEDKPPQSWAPQARERWGEIPEDLRKEIIRREEASVKGIRSLHDKYSGLEHFAGHLGDFIQEASTHNVNPGEYIAGVMQAERKLRSGTVEERFAALAEIADSYQIPLRDVINQLSGQEVLPRVQRQAQAAIPPEVQRELQESRQWRQDQVNREVQQFAADKNNEFFQDVKGEMATLLESGIAKDIPDAYRRACAMNENVSKVLTERASKKASGGDLKDRQAAAASASAKPSGKVATKPAVTEDSSIEDDLRAVIAEQSRV